MSEASQALQKIARGTGIVFAGTVISMFFGFLSRAIIARYFSTGEYGVFNLALTVLNIALVIATLGFQTALPREVAFYREREPSRVGDLVSTALIIVALNSVIWTAAMFYGAGIISQVFKEARLIYALKIVAFALPFSALLTLMISISRGFGRVRERVYFQNITYPTVFFVLILSGALLNQRFPFIFGAYIISQVLTLLVLIIDVWKPKLFEFKPGIDLQLGKELVAFSLPLLFVGILGFVLNWIDTIMVGYYLGSEAVGVYNAAVPLAKILPIFLSSVGFLYLPIASQLYATDRIKELKRTYQLTTKWVFILTFPLLMTMFLFPVSTITLFFGAKYSEASAILQVLSLGFMLHISLGLNGMLLTVIGEPKLNMVSDSFATFFNIILNALLIPRYHIMGAAVATIVSYFIANVFRSYLLYKKSGIHPFSRNYVRSLLSGFLLLIFIKILILVINVNILWHEGLVLLVSLILYGLLLVLTKSVDREDIDLLLLVEKKLGINQDITKGFLKGFV